jgi:hypothetical protein
LSKLDYITRGLGIHKLESIINYSPVNPYLHTPQTDIRKRFNFHNTNTAPHTPLRTELEHKIINIQECKEKIAAKYIKGDFEEVSEFKIGCIQESGF